MLFIDVFFNLFIFRLFFVKENKINLSHDFKDLVTEYLLYLVILCFCITIFLVFKFHLFFFVFCLFSLCVCVREREIQFRINTKFDGGCLLKEDHHNKPSRKNSN